MTKFVYRNRYSDEIVFENTDVNTLKMTGGEYYRFGAENEQMMKDGILDMVDPSGGPFLTSYMNFGHILKTYEGRITHSFNVMDGYIKVNLYPERIMKAITNGKAYYRVYSEDGELLKTLDEFNLAIDFIKEYERRQTDKVRY